MSSKKIKLVEIADTGEGTKLAFASYLKTDYVAKGLVISLDDHDAIKKLYFVSNDFGSVEWLNGIGLNDCHKWENDEQARSASALSKRYTAILANGEETLGYAEKNIIADVLENIDDQKLANLIKDVVQSKQYDESLDISTITN